MVVMTHVEFDGQRPVELEIPSCTFVLLLEIYTNVLGDTQLYICNVGDIRDTQQIPSCPPGAENSTEAFKIPIRVS